MSNGKFQRKEAGPDDFCEIDVAGIRATVFRLRKNGKRLPMYYVKGTVNGRPFHRSLRTSDKGEAILRGEKMFKAALDARWDVLDEASTRRRVIQAPEMRERIAKVVMAAISGEAVSDIDALNALERTITLPYKLRKFQGCASALFNCGTPAIYVLLKGERVLYVGQTTRLWARLHVHQKRFNFDTVYILHVVAEELNRVERMLIATFPEAQNEDAGRR